MGGGKPLPFYFAIVATIQSALPSSLKDVFNLIMITEIPENHRTIIQVIEDRFDRFPKQDLSYEAKKAIEHVRAEQFRHMDQSNLALEIMKQGKTRSGRPVEANQVS